MTTSPIQLISSTEDPALWSHPVLDLFAPPVREQVQQSAKLYLVPSTFGEELEPDEMPIPTSDHFLQVLFEKLYSSRVTREI